MSESLSNDRGGGNIGRPHTMDTNSRKSSWVGTIVLLWLLASWAVAGPAIPGWKWEPPSDRPFPIIAWYGPGAHLSNDEVWSDMADAGFSLCLPSFHGTTEQYRKILDLGEKHGIGLMLGGLVNWEWGRTEEKIGKLEPHIEAVVEKYTDEPALAMYVLKDEPHRRYFEPLALSRDHLARMDPGHVAYVNLYPSHAPVNEEENFFGTRDYQEYVDQYMEIYRPEVLIFDHYCIQGFRFREAEYAIRVRPEYYENLEIIRAAAKKHGVPFWSFTLSTPVFSYPTPTEGHLRFQLYSCLAYGARGLQYFTYGPAEGEDGLIDGEGTKGPWFDTAKRINREIQNMGELLLSLTSTAVRHTSPQPRGTTWLYEGHGGLKSCSGAPAVFGFFDGPDDRRFLMVVNRDPWKAAELTLTFDDGVTALEVDRSRPGGHVRPLDLVEGQLILPDGDGRLIEIVTD